MTNSEEVAAAFDLLELPSHDPNWSSKVLEKLLKDVLVDQLRSISDLFRGFDLALKRNNTPLNASVANLINDVVQVCFLTYQNSYMEADWGWANPRIAEGISPAQAYLFLLAPPPDQATPASLLVILQALEATSHFEEALHNLGDDFARPEVRKRLQQWRANGMRPEVAEKLDFFLVGC